MARGVLIVLATLVPAAALAMPPRTWREMLPRARPYLPHFREAARQTGVPLSLLLCVAKRESDFDPRSVSGVGAVGIMQVMNGPFDPRRNILAGARELREKVASANGSVHLGLASYAMGRRGLAVSLLADGDPPASVVKYARWIERCAGYRPDATLRPSRGKSGRR